MAKTLVLLYLFACSILTVVQAGNRKRLKTKRLRKIIFPHGRIVGGKDTDITQVPYQVQLERNGRPGGGGSILSASYVLTAAHCTDGASASRLTIRYATNNFNNGGSIVQVAKIAQHPLYNEDTIDYDVSVLRLKNEIKFSKKAQPIALTSVEPPGGVKAMISGWGNLYSGGPPPEQLQSVIVPIVDHDKCQAAYHVITQYMMCAGVGGKGSCQGDSGGALVTKKGQCGIVSWSRGCAQDNYPSVFANVATLRGFIDAHSDYTALWV